MAETCDKEAPHTHMRHILAYLLLTYPLVAATDKPVNPSPYTTTTATKAATTMPVLDLKGIGQLAEAAKRTKEFLVELGYKPTSPTGDPADGIWIRDMDIGITVLPFPSSKGLDRLIITCGVPGKGPGLLKDLAALQALNNLNNNFNVCTIVLTETGDVGFCTSLNFSDTLDGKVFRQHIEFLLGFTSHFLTTDDPAVAADRDKLVK